MRIGSVVSEAMRNLASGTAHALTMALTAAALIGTLAALDVRGVVEILSEAQEFKSAGAAVQILERDHGVSGQRCDALGAVVGTGGAGAVREGGAVQALALPSSDLPVWEVTNGVLDVLGSSRALVTSPNAARSGVWLSSDLAETLSIGAGDTFETTAGQAMVAGVFVWPDDGRMRSFGHAILIPVQTPGTFDQCWVQVWPHDEEVAALAFTALEQGSPDESAGGLSLTQLNGTQGVAYDVQKRLSTRLTRWAPVSAAGVGFVLGAVAVRRRRLEVAGTLHALVPRPHLMWQHLIEATVWTAMGATIAGAATLFSAIWGNPDPGLETWLIGLRTVGAGSVAILFGTLVGVLATREKHLFRYFKDR